jgi:Ca2+-transporting ATPase
MTAVELVVRLRVHEVTGSGYGPVGAILPLPGDEPVSLGAALLPMALCNDAVLRQDDDTNPDDDGAGWILVGDPTEGALLSLAGKGGIDATDLRRRHPRIAEVPFDSANKFMMTAHEMVTAAGTAVVRLYVKGAPDVLLARSANAIDEHGAQIPIAVAEPALIAHNDRQADLGRRVIAVAQREMSPEAWNEFMDSSGAPVDLVSDLTILALIGIVDPPRPEARQAISEAHAAGIQVKMITGDHAVTAAAIGRELGLRRHWRRTGRDE